MNLRQKILKVVYPFLMKWGKKTGISYNQEDVHPYLSFYFLQARLSNGYTFPFSSLRGKYVMITNVASRCGYTNQNEQLEELYKKMGDRVVVLGFPSND